MSPHPFHLSVSLPYCTSVYGGLVHAHTRQFDGPRPEQTPHRRSLLLFQLLDSVVRLRTVHPLSHLPLISETRNRHMQTSSGVSTLATCGATHTRRRTSHLESPTDISSVAPHTAQLLCTKEWKKDDSKTGGSTFCVLGTPIRHPRNPILFESSWRRQRSISRRRRDN